MPATRTRAQRPYVPYAYSSSSSESSVLDQRTPFPYIRIPKISLLDYGRLLSDEETFDDIMATIGHRRSLVNQSKTIRHLWLTSRHLLEEVDKQRHEARRIFTQMERMGLQQELYGSRFTALPVRGRSERSTPLVSPLSTQPSCSLLSSQLSQFHSCKETVINDDLSDYHESEAPLTSLSSLPLHHWERLETLLLSTMTKMISIGCSVAQVIMRCDRHSLPRRFNYSIVKTVLTEATITSSAPSIFATTVSCMLLTIANPIAQTVESR
jgi:hypothetical protein